MPLDAVLPAFLIALIGYMATLKLTLDANTLSRVCLYILTPTLSFYSLATSSTPLSTTGLLAISGLTVPFILWFAFTALAKALKWDDEKYRSMSLPAIFANTGNFGLPVLLFAFGQEGMDLGVIVMSTQTILMFSLGIYLAASSKMDPKRAFAQVFRMPSIYALTLGVIVRLMNVTLPGIIERPASLLAGATAPIYLLVLGSQLAGVKGDLSLSTTSIVVGFRLLCAPIFAGLVGYTVGLRGLPLWVLTLEQGMPSAVNMVILANEFDANPSGVSKVTLASTLASLVTLTMWITLFRNML